MASGSDTAPHEVHAALSESFYYRDGLLATPPSLESQYAQFRYGPPMAASRPRATD